MERGNRLSCTEKRAWKSKAPHLSKGSSKAGHLTCQSFSPHSPSKGNVSPSRDTSSRSEGLFSFLQASQCGGRAAHLSRGRAGLSPTHTSMAGQGSSPVQGASRPVPHVHPALRLAGPPPDGRLLLPLLLAHVRLHGGLHHPLHNHAGPRLNHQLLPSHASQQLPQVARAAAATTVSAVAAVAQLEGDLRARTG